MAEQDWTWEVSLTPPPRFKELELSINGFASGDIDDPMTIARIIAQHIAREFVNRMFEEVEGSKVG